MHFQTFISSAVLLVAAANAAPFAKRDVPTSVQIAVRTADNEGFLLDTGKAYLPKNAFPTGPIPPGIPMPEPGPEPLPLPPSEPEPLPVPPPSAPEIPAPNDPSIPMPSAKSKRMPPIPPGRFTVTVIGGTGEDVLVNIASFAGACQLVDDKLNCWDTDASVPAAVFRARKLETGEWALLGGYSSFSIEEGQDLNLSVKPQFDLKASLFMQG